MKVFSFLSYTCEIILQKYFTTLWNIYMVSTGSTVLDFFFKLIWFIKITNFYINICACYKKFIRYIYTPIILSENIFIQPCKCGCNSAAREPCHRTGKYENAFDRVTHTHTHTNNRIKYIYLYIILSVVYTKISFSWTQI